MNWLSVRFYEMGDSSSENCHSLGVNVIQCVNRKEVGSADYIQLTLLVYTICICPSAHLFRDTHCSLRATASDTVTFNVWSVDTK